MVFSGERTGIGEQTEHGDFGHAEHPTSGRNRISFH
jgi:hypothetical protein